MYGLKRQTEPFSVSKYGKFSGTAGTWVTVPIFIAPNGKVIHVEKFGCFLIVDSSGGKAGSIFGTGYWATLADNLIYATRQFIDEVEVKVKINGAEMSYFNFNLMSFGNLSAAPQQFKYDFHQNDKLVVEFRQIAASAIDDTCYLIFRCDGSIDQIERGKE